MSKNLVLTINVAEDEDLRNYIKELVKGQVQSIIRQELFNIVSDMLSEKVAKSVKNVDVNEEIRKMLQEQIKRSLPSAQWSKPDAIKEIAKEEVRAVIREKIGGMKVIESL